jgi:uncharacterized SAM-binding protein YcdF (DUF218 family)
MPHAAPPRATFWQKLGPGGFTSLALAFLGGTVTLGIPLWFCQRKVLDASKGEALHSADAILVLGRRLVGDQPTEVFKQRLEHAAALWLMGLAPRVIVSGGITGDATWSEADAGHAWLMEQGLPDESVLVEDRSQHTLENLFNIRAGMRERGWTTLILVSDPLHLARALAFAKGFGLWAIGSPATACPPRPGSFGWWLRSLREAFLLHWYRTGMAYSRLIRSEKQLSRVT